MLSWNLHSAPVWTGRSPGGRRSAVYHGWWDTGAWTLDSLRTAPFPPSMSVRSPSLAPLWSQPPTRQRGCCRDPRPWRAWRGRAPAPSLCDPVEEPRRLETLDRTSAECESEQLDSSATQSWPGQHRGPEDLDVGGSEPHGFSLVGQSSCLDSFHHCVSESLTEWRCLDQHVTPLQTVVWTLMMLLSQTCGDQGLTNSQSNLNWEKCQWYRNALPQFCSFGVWWNINIYKQDIEIYSWCDTSRFNEKTCPNSIMCTCISKQYHFLNLNM